MLEVLPDVDGRGSLKFDLQEVAYCDDQVRVIDSFGATCVLEGVRVTVGRGSAGCCTTSTLAVASPVPPGPVQVTLYV